MIHLSLGRVFKQSLFIATITIAILILASGARAATIVVPPGGDLQAALNAANCGDTLILSPSRQFLTCMLPEDVEGLVWLMKHLVVGLIIILIFRGAQLAKLYIERRLDQASAKQHCRKKRRKPQSGRGN
jgi:hypothetical protein